MDILILKFSFVYLKFKFNYTSNILFVKSGNRTPPAACDQVPAILTPSGLRVITTLARPSSREDTPSLDPTPNPHSTKPCLWCTTHWNYLPLCPAEVL